MSECVKLQLGTRYRMPHGLVVLATPSKRAGVACELAVKGEAWFVVLANGQIGALGWPGGKRQKPGPVILLPVPMTTEDLTPV